MTIDVVLLPSLLRAGRLRNATAVVFDVLRATTTMTAAMEAGAREIRVFTSLHAAADATARFDGAKLLCGELHCLPPAGFDLGNSPASFSSQTVEGKTVFMCTTNGTRALTAAQDAAHVYVGALTNARAVAEHLASQAADNEQVVLLCAGTNGEVAMEDTLGAGAVIDSLQELTSLVIASDCAEMALRLYRSASTDLAGALRCTRGGRNVIAAGLGDDITFAAHLNASRIVGECRALVVRKQLV
jgi:2-phosphosulfolactate phosphatase